MGWLHRARMRGDEERFIIDSPVWMQKEMRRPNRLGRESATRENDGGEKFATDILEM